ncbi:uncharacterized protein LOC143051052 [Mytilus galloprovincialis]|uniref:uncharacterized protein LOC143051052 n=1 Tax=Mytilus galloprovincialis TaxID=29158 RepID=UPI003F7B9495
MWQVGILILFIASYAQQARSTTPCLKMACFCPLGSSYIYYVNGCRRCTCNENSCPQYASPEPGLCTGQPNTFYVGKVKCYGPPKIIPCSKGSTPKPTVAQ